MSEERTTRADSVPGALRDRMLAMMEEVTGALSTTDTALDAGSKVNAGSASNDQTAVRVDPNDPAALASAGMRSLRKVLDSPGDRASGFELLVADALLTQACEAAAAAPGEVAAFAGELLHDIVELTVATEMMDAAEASGKAES